MTRLTADDTQPALRALAGRICPRCRARLESAGDPGEVVRCPADGFAMVPPSILAEADGDPFLGATLAGRFVVLGKVGAGSMGTVYRARQEAVGRDVAIKILRSDRAFDAQAKARFTREARAMSLLASPHTVTVFDFGEVPDGGLDGDDLASGSSSLFLAMELLEGESLGQRLKRTGRLPADEAVRIAKHTLLSLAEAHDKGVIHRDLKPDNLLLTRVAGNEQEEVCKVLDFGIAKVMSGSARVDALETQAGTVFGTPRYMSPEQAQGAVLDARSDLYSLGVLLYQMLTGRAPFVDDDAVVVMARHIKSMPKSPIEAAPEAKIGPALSAVVMRALAKDPADRPPSARQFIAELDRALEGPREPRRASHAEAAAGATGATAALVRDDLGEPTAPSSGKGRRSTTLVLLALAGALLAVGGLWRFASPSPPSPARAAPAAAAGSVPALAAPPEVAAVAPAVSAPSSGPPASSPSTEVGVPEPVASTAPPGASALPSSVPPAGAPSAEPFAPPPAPAPGRRRLAPRKSYTRFE